MHPKSLCNILGWFFMCFRASGLFVFPFATRSRFVKSVADAKHIAFVKHRRFSRVSYGNTNSSFATKHYNNPSDVFFWGIFSCK